MTSFPATWIITREEREKHDAQFNLLNPVNDLVSGSESSYWEYNMNNMPINLIDMQKN